MDSLIIIFTIMWVVVVPLIKNTAHKQKKKTARAKRRDPSKYGAITLDGQVISVRGKGLLDPEALYTRTEK